MNTQHTPEPWKLSGTENIVAGGNYVVALDCKPEDARRIVACVNACAGIETEQLEVEKYLNTASYALRCKAEKQRDDLLAAIEFARDKISELHLEAGDGDCHYPIVDDAIEFVKGGAA